MVRTLLKGYYGFHNAGDDALLLVTSWGARTYCHANEVFVAASSIPLRNMVHGRSIHSDWPYFRRYNTARENRLARTAHVIIWGGGSVFQSTRSIDQGRLLLDNAPATKAFAIGVSVGPFCDRESERACGELLSRLRYVGVRDRISWERAIALAPGARIEMTFDLAPLLLRLGPYHNQPTSQPIAAFRRGIGVALCGSRTFVERLGDCKGVSVRAIAEAIQSVAASGGVDEVTVFDFGRYPAHSGCDTHVRLLRLIRLMSPHLRVRRRLYNDDPFALMEAIGGVKLLLAMPLHASVFAFCTRTPTIILPYHEKCREWARVIGQPSSLLCEVRDLGARELAMQIIEALGDRAVLPSLPVESAQALAAQNWSGVSAHMA